MNMKIGLKQIAAVVIFSLLFPSAFVCLSTESAEAASVKMNKSSVTLSLDQTKTATVKAQGLSGKITWSTSNSKVITVKANGTKSAKITASGAGRAIVYAKAGVAMRFWSPTAEPAGRTPGVTTSASGPRSSRSS